MLQLRSPPPAAEASSRPHAGCAPPPGVRAPEGRGRGLRERPTAGTHSRAPDGPACVHADSPGRSGGRSRPWELCMLRPRTWGPVNSLVKVSTHCFKNPGIGLAHFQSQLAGLRVAGCPGRWSHVERTQNPLSGAASARDVAPGEGQGRGAEGSLAVPIASSTLREGGRERPAVQTPSREGAGEGAAATSASSPTVWGPEGQARAQHREGLKGSCPSRLRRAQGALSPLPWPACDPCTQHASN